MNEKFAVIGLGQFGLAVAKRLSKKGAEVLAIDIDESRIEIIKDDVAYAVALDSTDYKALYSQNVVDMDAVLVAIGENFEAQLITIVQLLEMKCKRIIARAMNDQQRMILEKMGVKEIISPENEAAEIVSEMLLNPTMKNFLALPDNHEIAEIQAPSRIVKKTIDEIDFEDSYNIQLIAIKRKYEEFENGRRIFKQHLIRKPNRNIAIEKTDELILLGLTAEILKFVEINQ
ncbi:MAG: TrkA family potassium uptake protein [Flammeovirgaceae bacterium]|nr:TrkA family potassium uptake protein [Flammeovirgaceae bacterium]MDW8286544.1 TrkA family potassium uptake protein [Flammeovirgaceae bacterium]